jgi:hypothetical protein
MNNFIKNLGIGKVVLIKDWLSNQGITDYTLDDEYRISTNCYINIQVDGNLPEYIDFKFVYDFTLIGSENTTSLKGCPEIVKRNFKCCECKNLKTLEGCPRLVNCNFIVENNGIENLEDIKEYPFFPQQARIVSLYGNPITKNSEILRNITKKIYSICNTNRNILLYIKY